MKLKEKKTAGNTMVVSAMAITTATLSCEEACIPPVTVAKSDKLDAGNPPLLSCASKKYVCINSTNNKKSCTSSLLQEQTRVCYDICDLSRTYMFRSGQRNEADPSSASC